MQEVQFPRTEFGGAITTTNATINANLCNDDYVLVQLSGTFAGLNCAFEVSNDSNDGITGTWVPVQAIRTVGNAVDTSIGALSAAPPYLWQVFTAGARWFRIRRTALTSGSAVFSCISTTARYAALAVNVGTTTVSPAWPASTHINSSAGTNLTSVKNASGSVFNVTAFNAGPSAAFVKLYAKSSAPVLATDVPVVVIPLAAGAAISWEFGALGKRLSPGIAMAITGAAADTDATAVAASQVKVSVDYS